MFCYQVQQQSILLQQEKSHFSTYPSVGLELLPQTNKKPLNI
jgi:hypothetical protein